MNRRTLRRPWYMSLTPTGNAVLCIAAFVVIGFASAWWNA